MHKSIKTFFKSEIAIGISLLLATAAALFVANSEGYKIYQDFFLIKTPLQNFTLHDFINDALMALFFLLIGLELKREVLVGELSSKKKIALPAIAAFGGIIIPLLIFYFFNHDDAQSLRGFAVPCATDIAFAYGMIALFGKKISNSLKVFVVALAVLDDLVAILIIAFFYSDDIQAIYLLLSALVLCALAILNFFAVRKIYFYLVLGVILWLMILKSGIHPTLAGVLLAMFIPLNIKKEAPLSKLAHQIAPLVNFLILPIFAFANAGVHIENFSADFFSHPLILGVAGGLFFGKQIGVMLFSFVAVKLKIANLPHGTNWSKFYGAAIFTGIGFTMSLFIGSLAFSSQNELFDLVKIGVLLGSILSVLYGSLVIYFNRNS